MRAVRAILRLLVASALVIFTSADLYVWLAHPPDPPLGGLYADAARWSGFWPLFHAALVLLLTGGLLEGTLTGRELVRDAERGP